MKSSKIPMTVTVSEAEQRKRGQQRRQKHVPERMCVSCREKRPKWELVRIVRTPQGNVEIDARGKRAGRGTYLCRRRQCWEVALKQRRLERALKADIAPEQRAELAASCEAFPEVVGDKDSLV